ncbi:hypothetical protein C7H83_10210 [Tetragenococcus halophilus]|uniref:Uncharacterized protein n=1 Tax=Tetragenococcus halophilus TaxID=51669 RepID=A0A3G5FKH2_TETHA|nr:hypothetical protein [Tetragenococcus halophilus]AYW50814.1 hypothetical protein C7H83_10210 [Tetragenococcus halophilus]GBD64898.1 hypothetical protein TEHD23766T_2325 [Tetragenococcus halophilus subsp. flandriensis]GMA08912.1 hypothetical protein GCM10025886_20630 [Tetragenococcus halophilus subsp. flandriensis]
MNESRDFNLLFKNLEKAASKAMNAYSNLFYEIATGFDMEQNERICHLASKGFDTSDAKIIVKIESDMTVELEELERFSKLLD